MLQGKVAESMDAIMQRLKSIELTASGMAWSTAQKIEIVPSPEAAISSRQEMHLAKKEAKLDSEAKAPAAGSEKGKGKTKDKGKEKGKEKGKGKPKETEGKK
jgi:flagellar biosynthesis/type III secretory pathway protein FliH